MTLTAKHPCVWAKEHRLIYFFFTQVVPWYVSIDSTPSDIEIYWDRAAEDGMREMEIVYTFPHTFPEGIFERMSTQLQQDADIRLDWANTIYIEAKDKKTLVRRFVNQTSSEINVQIQVNDLKNKAS